MDRARCPTPKPLWRSRIRKLLARPRHERLPSGRVLVPNDSRHRGDARSRCLSTPLHALPPSLSFIRGGWSRAELSRTTSTSAATRARRGLSLQHHSQTYDAHSPPCHTSRRCPKSRREDDPLTWRLHAVSHDGASPLRSNADPVSHSSRPERHAERPTRTSRLTRPRSHPSSFVTRQPGGGALPEEEEEEEEEGELHYKNAPTPCLWKAPASAQKAALADRSRQERHRHSTAFLP